ncbi:hypothetical protein BDV93DRAFT_517768 [Ceratobasidium sp. AG-I]|nr:hypothetical protein BDV93DRAFT_517768 [Ceratobasidium sp. AG-I]
MQLVFTPDLGSSTTLAAAPGTVLQFAARVATRDYNDAVAAGTFVELWGDLPRPGVAAGEWGATRFVPAPTAPEHHDAGVPPNVLSLLPADPEPVPTSSAAPETTLLVASFVIPADTDTIDYQFTYRLAHANDSHTWLGDTGSNGHLTLKPDAPPIEGLVFSAAWNSRENDHARESIPDGIVANLAGPIEWSGWALDLDATAETPITPKRFSKLPTAIEATHIALFPTPGLTALNPAAHTPILLSTASRLSFSDRALHAHGSPIHLTPLSRSALASSLPEHVVLLEETAVSAPFVVLHDTRGTSLALLPAGISTPGTQLLSLDLEKVAATPPAKTLLYSAALGTASLYTPESRVAVGPLGADIQVCEVHSFEGENWEAGLLGGLKVEPDHEPEPELKEEVESDAETESGEEPAPAPVPEPVAVPVVAPEPTKLAPPPILTTTNAQNPEHTLAVSPVTPQSAVTVTETTITHRATTPNPAHAADAQKKNLIEILRGVAAVVVYYVTRGAWKMFGWGFKMFGVGVHAAKASTPSPPTPAPAPAEQTPTVNVHPASPEPEVEESESESDTVAPTPIDPAGSSISPVVVSGESNVGDPRRPDVHMPLTPPMSPKTAAPVPIPGPEVISTRKQKTPKPKVVVPQKPRLAFTIPTPTKSMLMVVSPIDANPSETLQVSVGGDKVPVEWDAVNVAGGENATAWVTEVVGEGKVQVGLA